MGRVPMRRVCSSGRACAKMAGQDHNVRSIWTSARRTHVQMVPRVSMAFSHIRACAQLDLGDRVLTWKIIC